MGHVGSAIRAEGTARQCPQEAVCLVCSSHSVGAGAAEVEGVTDRDSIKAEVKGWGADNEGGPQGIGGTALTSWG